MLIGLIVGAFGTLIGAGGGFILMPILFFLYPQEPSQQLTSISLLVVFFNALSGSVAYGRQKRIDYQSGFLFALASIPGAILGALTTAYFSREIFDPLFGGILILISGYLFMRPQSQETKKSTRGRFRRIFMDKDGARHAISYNAPLGILMSVFIGFLSTFLGIGGGIIHVPMFSHLLNFPVHIATATSQFILGIVAFFGSCVHIFNGELSQSFYKIVFLAPSVMVGAQIGARFSHQIHQVWIIRFLAGGLMLTGIRILLASISL